MNKECNICGTDQGEFIGEFCVRCNDNPYINSPYNEAPMFTVGKYRVECRHPRDDDIRAGMIIGFEEESQELEIWKACLENKLSKFGIEYIKENYFIKS